MGSAWLDEVSPRYLRDSRIDLQLDPANPHPTAFQSVLVNVSYVRTLPQGVVLPLVLEVMGPSKGSYQRRVFTRTAPDAVVIRPTEGGPHVVVLREVAHNRWFGRLALQVAGERLETPRPS